MLPNVSDLGSVWKVDSIIPSSTRFDIQSTPPITPVHTIEESLEKTTDNPSSLLTIDIASFQGNGMSEAFQSKASFAYHVIINDWLNQHHGYSQSSFTSTPVDASENCYIYSLSTTESTKVDMFCVKGATMFVIDASGNDLSMADDVKSITNDMLIKIPSYGQ